MYRYHTHNLGWSDIAYNFLVDRFGRVWEGRAGGVTRRVRGAHTLGFNATSSGIAVIGNYDLTTPNVATVDAVALVAAWKLSMYGGNPLAAVRVDSEGSDRFKRGKRVELPTIDGHRNTNDTACPGDHLYALLPKVRQRAKVMMVEAAKTLLGVLEVPVLSGVPEVGQAMSVTPGRYDAANAKVAYTWGRDGQDIPNANSSTYRCVASDFGRQLSVRITGTARGRLPVTQIVAAPTAVQAQPTLSIQSPGGRGRARVTVSVTAPAGVRAIPTGSILIRIGKRTQALELTNGKATARFDHLHKGRRRVTASYAGAGGFNPATNTASVVVRPTAQSAG